MSHEVQTMAYTNEVPWHGLGVKLTEDAGIDVWKKEAGMEWTGELAPAQFETPTCYIEVPGRKVLYRSDNFHPLSIVSDRYKPVHPGEILEFFRDLVEKYKGFKLETAGVLFDGKKVWALARSTSEDVLFDAVGDRVLRYLLLATSYDLSIPTIVQQTSVRVVCNNTLGFALSAGDAKAEPRITVSHRTNFDQDVVRQRMMLDEQWKMFGDSMQRLMQKKMTDEAARIFFVDVFFPEELRKAQNISEKSINRKVDELMAAYRNAPGSQLDSAKATAWGALNAVTYGIDHASRARTADSRLDRAWFGEGQTIKSRATARALQFAGN